MKNLLILIFFLGSCTPFLTSTQLNEKTDLDLIFIPHKSYIKMGLDPQVKLGKGVLKDDLYVILSETRDRIYVHPFYKTSPGLGGMGYKIVTVTKDEKGFIAAIYGKDNKRAGYVYVQNKRSLDLVIDLEKENDGEKTTLKISAYCKKPEEVKEIDNQGDILLATF